ncbi:PREDICTED: C-type lectin domain family 10 member A-like [Branchiostoma belcheri]|uniref:C-type lectin domain family 10 member A-like n=1 Tax=Branchiostoma belcheri TaxID=7741 RepID=A0A6P4YAN5_BRABE|nr:PREDICTED: C-type lectin domain family 10 member A-like [Branchiostoma belcheri]
MFRRKPVKWDTANKICKGMGAHLASVHDKKENNFIKSLISTVPNTLVWVGLSDVHKKMKWADGTRVSYTNWDPGQPDNYMTWFSWVTGEDCGGLYNKGGKWNDSRCDRKYPFVCKAHVTGVN